jgi:hypothetical protein
VDLATGAGNFGITWNSSTSICMTSEVMMTIIDCGPRAGLDDFDSEVIIDITMEFDWGFSGDPSVVRSMAISAWDDAGQSSRVTPTHMDWRFSSEVEVDQSSITLANASSWVLPLQDNSVHGNLIWHRDKIAVLEDISIEIEIDDIPFLGTSAAGEIEVKFQTPSDSGVYPLTIRASDLPTGGLDRTDDSVVVAWVIVDSAPPVVNGLISPRSDEIIPEWMWDNLSVEVSIDEVEGLDMDTMVMKWVVLPAGLSFHSLAIATGNSSLELLAGHAQGSAIPMHAIINLEETIPLDLRSNALDLRLWVEGKDLAGQNIDLAFNNGGTPLAVLRLANREFEIRFSKEDITFSTDEPLIDSPLQIDITIHNDGLANGTIRVRVESVKPGGLNGDYNRVLIEVFELKVDAGGSENISIQWIPKLSGTVWFEFSLPNGHSVYTDSMEAKEGDTSLVISSFDTADNVALSAVAIITIILILLLIILWRKPIDLSENESGIDNYNSEF